MLTQEDLKAIAELVNTAVGASENRIMSYIESHVEKEIHQLADGHKMLSEKVDRLEKKVDRISDRLDEIEGELTAQEYVIKRMKKAQ